MKKSILITALCLLSSSAFSADASKIVMENCPSDPSNLSRLLKGNLFKFESETSPGNFFGAKSLARTYEATAAVETKDGQTVFYYNVLVDSEPPLAEKTFKRITRIDFKINFLDLRTPLYSTTSTATFYSAGVDGKTIVKEILNPTSCHCFGSKSLMCSFAVDNNENYRFTVN